MSTSIFVRLTNMKNEASDAGSLRRGVVLLKLLATAGVRGLALTELASRAGIPHPTAHRILRQLIAENLAAHNAETRRYKLGPLAFELGVAGSTMYDIRDLCQSEMDTLVETTGDTTYLVVRSGFDAVCMHRREGSFPIRALVLEVGSRRPLGVGAGGLAILAAIEADERAEIIERVAPMLPDFGNLDAAALAAACDQTNREGIAIIHNRVSLGVTAIGLPFRDSLGQAIGALSVAAMSQRMAAARIDRIGKHLQKAVAAVERRLTARRQ